MSNKYYIDKDDIVFGTEVEWGFDRCGEVVDFYTTGVDTYLIVRPYDTPDECVLIPKSNASSYVYRLGVCMKWHKATPNDLPKEGEFVLV